MTVARYSLSSDPEVLKLAFDELGTKEGPGTKDNPVVLEYYSEAGFPGIKHDSVAWCAAFVGAMLARAGLPNSKSLAARSYLEWGRATHSPKRGDIVVFGRGTGWQGHVAFYLGEANGRIYHLGGNQSDAVTVSSTPRSKVLGFRSPVTATNSRTYKTAALIGTTTAGGTAYQLYDAVTQAGYNLQSTGMQWAAIAGGLLVVAGVVYICWARYTDWRNKAR